ncbi:NDE2, mitochondrial external NADH dehydrogenase [Agaricus bisporus var. burnettii JB137-S8]|uniref:NADH:ubiquinone reductase (non-electrogenic) n=1 Tax=Agaricus bisporus var. burnettii (strain JB137-S8 / ATCC MYA-4627 / FGSC 10392) TaxID=597362 RepID=K5X594_AGABU|nr:NDE2, mitochondrial external NADH dehydrogenase [Agaricus bisporus var. burnettii JB137-S8]EKM78363.1 NDE2, mitochondrial external NADH dehydrogenase [Agaricus bisporus var. burnettii JB137-S8]
MSTFPSMQGLLNHSSSLNASSFRAARFCIARKFSSTAAREKQRVVILGSGWGGYGLLRGIDKKRYDVVVISPTTYFNFTPLLASTAVGTLEFRTAIEPVRRYVPAAVYYQAWCDNIDFSRKTLTCMPATRPITREASDPTKVDDPNYRASANIPFTARYDKLIIAVGAYSQTFNIPGVKEHAYFLKDVKDARRIRSRILECFEQANQPVISDVERRNLLNFCVVGGGPTGVEFAAELHDLLQTDVRTHYPDLARFTNITLYDVADSILSSFDQSLVKYTEKMFSREGVHILTNHHVERVEAGKLFIREKGEVPFGLLVWSTGLAPNPLVSAMSGVKKNPKTQSVITNDQLNVIMQETNEPNPDVWAIGDAATFEEAPLPATAQVASQKAHYMITKLNTLAKDKDHCEPFEFHNQGSLAYIGNWNAIYDRSSTLPEGEKDKFMSKETGRVAWLLWRSAYFTMTLSWRNKILVPTYWFLNWMFGRDMTRF